MDVNNGINANDGFYKMILEQVQQMNTQMNTLILEQVQQMNTQVLQKFDALRVEMKVEMKEMKEELRLLSKRVDVIDARTLPTSTKADQDSLLISPYNNMDNSEHSLSSDVKDEPVNISSVNVLLNIENQVDELAVDNDNHISESMNEPPCYESSSDSFDILNSHSISDDDMCSINRDDFHLKYDEDNSLISDKKSCASDLTNTSSDNESDFEDEDEDGEDDDKYSVGTCTAIIDELHGYQYFHRPRLK
jgi:hypothetical protein